MLADIASERADEEVVRKNVARILLSGARMNAAAMTSAVDTPHLCRSFASISLFMTQACMNVLQLEELPSASTLADVLDAVNAVQTRFKCPSRPSCAESAAYFMQSAQFAVKWAQQSVGDARQNALLEAFFYASTAEFYIRPIREVKYFVRFSLTVYYVPSDPMLAALEEAGRLAAAKLNVYARFYL